MGIAYQYDARGYYAGEVEDYGLLPNNATHEEPLLVDDCIPHWTGETWEQIENHKGRKGFVSGEPKEITEYGPLPDGWSDTPPPPTPKEAMETRLNELAAHRDSLYFGGFTYQIVPYSLDESTRNKMHGIAVTLAPMPDEASIDWWDEDNALHTFTAAAWGEFMSAILWYSQAIWRAWAAHRTAITALREADVENANAIVDAILAYDITTGWPEPKV